MSKLTSIAIICACLLGGVYVAKSYITPPNNYQPVVRTEDKKVTVRKIDYFAVQEEIGKAIKESKAIALASARTELDTWHKQRMRDIEADFLDWYFGYWRTQSSTFGSLWNRMWDGEAAAKMKLQADIAAELSARGLSGHHIDNAVSRAGKVAGTVFTNELRERFDKVGSDFSIPPAEWASYLDRISLTATNKANSMVDNKFAELTAKGLFASGGLVATKAIAGGVSKAAAAKVAAGATAAAAKGVAGKAALAMVGKGAAIKGGAIATAKAGSLAGGPIVAGVVIGGLGLFEAFTHGSFVKSEKPKMRKRISENLAFFEESLIANDGAIGSSIGDIEENMLNSITRNKAELKAG